MVKYFKLTQEKNERESIEERFFRTLLLRNGCLLEANWHLLFQVDADIVARLLEESIHEQPRLDQLFLKK